MTRKPDEQFSIESRACVAERDSVPAIGNPRRLVQEFREAGFGRPSRSPPLSKLSIDSS
jgi:hypothetical protein